LVGLLYIRGWLLVGLLYIRRWLLVGLLYIIGVAFGVTTVYKRDGLWWDYCM
jgi:hypothetical protein